MRKNLYKSVVHVLAVAIAVVCTMAPSGVYAQWHIYNGSVSPESISPRPFIRATNIFTAPDNFDNHNVIVSEPVIPTNSLLRMSNTVNGTQFLWRMNFAAHSSLPAIAVTNLTVVMRVKGHAGAAHTFDVDLDYNGQRSRMSLTTATRLLRIRNGIGTNATLPVAPTEWVIYRFAMTPTQTRVFINEDPTPIMTFTPATSSQNHFRFGDGDGGATLGADIDWVIWDISGSNAPGEGTPLPVADLTPEYDIRLTDLQVAGNPIPGFNPVVVHYEVILPQEASAPSAIAATAALGTSTVVITQANTIPGTGTVAVTSQDGLTTRTYSVHFRKFSTNANLATLTAGGSAVAGFNPDITSYDIVLPAGTTTAPIVAATVADPAATLTTTQASAVPGTATVVVRAEDGSTKTYTVNFRFAATNANLATLLVGGTAIAGFDPAVITYELALPPATTTPPSISATAADTRATVLITQATAIPGAATVRVTAEDGTTLVTYTINFRLQSTNANLATLLAGGTAIAGFDPAVITYELALPPATTTPPSISATAADTRATVLITQATAIPGTATVRVTAEDGTTLVTYTINFRLQSVNANLSNLLVGGTAITGFSPDVTTYNVVLPAGTTTAPAVTAVLADTRATMIITQAVAIPGFATVVVTAEAANQRTYQINFSTDPTLVNKTLEQSFRIFPNPATSSLNLNWKGSERAEVEIISLNGHVVLSKTIDSQSTRLDINHLPAGIYVIRLRSGVLETRQTFIKQQQ